MKKLLSLVLLAASVVGARAELLYVDMVRSGSAPRKEKFADEIAARPCRQECRDYESITLRFVSDGSEVVYTISYEQGQELGLNFLHMLCCDIVPLEGPLDLEARNHRGQLRYPGLSAESFGLIMRLRAEGYDYEVVKFTTRSFDNFLRTVVDEGLKAGRPVLGCKTPLTLAFKLARVLDTLGSVEPVRLLMEVATSNEYWTMTTAADAEIIKQMDGARHIDTAFTPHALVPHFKEEKTLSGHVNSILSIAWSPSGKFLTSVGYDRTVRFWNIADKTVTELKGHADQILSIASPNGKYLASAVGGGTVRVWNIEDKTSTEFTGHTDLICSISWSPDSKYLACAGGDRIVRVWNIENKACTEFTDHTDYIELLAWSSNGKSLASTGKDRSIRVWNIEDKTCTEIKGQTDYICSIALSPNGKYLAGAVNNGIVRVWNIANKTCTEFTSHTDQIRSIVWSPDGKYLASAGDDGIVYVWNIEDKTSTEFTGHTDQIRSIAWSPDGKSLASAGCDRIVRVWNIEDKTCKKLAGHTDQIRSIAWSPDGKSLASAGCDRIVRVWNIEDKTCKKLAGHTCYIELLAWSPNGKSLASTGNDGIVRVWSNEALDKCSPSQKLFVLINLPKKLKMFERVTLRFSKLLERVGLRAGDEKPIAQWLGVYQSLPEQAKKILDKDVQEKFEHLSLSKVLAFGTEKTRKDCTKSLATMALKSFGESAFRKIGLLIRQNKPVEEILRFFAQHGKEFGDRAGDVLSGITRYASVQAKERGDGASSSDASSSKP